MNQPMPDLATPLMPQRPSLAVNNAASESEQQRAIAETQAAMIIAKRFPRDQKQALDNVMNACTRQGLAEVSLYSYSRGGTDITGPSIRLAEALAQEWGNMQWGIRELSQGNGESTVEAFAWDMERNTRQVKIFQVPHIRYSKAKGNTKLEDPRDIYELIANNGARRLRACILGIIPGDVVEAAQRQCETTLATQADTSPATVKKMVDAFLEHGVTSEMIEGRIQRRLDAINAAQIVQLRKVFNSLKDGMSKAADWFDTSLSKKEVAETATAATAGTAPAAKPKATGFKKKEKPEHDPETGEIKEEVAQQNQEAAESVPPAIRNMAAAQAAASGTKNAGLDFGE